MVAQGLGSVLLRRKAAAPLGQGRTILTASSASLEPAGAAFLTTCGLEARQQNGENRLHLADLPPALLHDWTIRQADEYTLEIWHGDIPEAQLEAYRRKRNCSAS